VLFCGTEKISGQCGIGKVAVAIYGRVRHTGGLSVLYDSRTAHAQNTQNQILSNNKSCLYN
jgi:hypothetical protein